MINYAHLKSQMIQLLDLLRSILYPNVFDAMEEAHSKEELEAAARRQFREILKRIYREPPQYDDVIDTLFSKLPAIRDTLDTDVQAAYEGDPAATCREEVMLAYPAFEAISIFRIAHELYLMKVPMLPRMMTEYAHSHGWEIYEIYIDDDYSGADRSRPAFKRMLHAAEEKRFDIILCKTQSRFSRELEVVERYINRLLPQWGIRFLSLVDNADSANEDNLLLRQINGIMDEHYLAELSKNIRSVLTHRRKNGFHIGSFALYGYKKNPDRRGHLLIDEEAAAVVREVFTLFSQGYGKTAIARMLNERGIPNPTEYKRLQGIHYRQPKGKGSTLWKYFAISNMLTNEIYIGNMVQGK